jgi:hypothetical protein
LSGEAETSLISEGRDGRVYKRSDAIKILALEQTFERTLNHPTPFPVIKVMSTRSKNTNGVVGL